MILWVQYTIANLFPASLFTKLHSIRPEVAAPVFLRGQHRAEALSPALLPSVLKQVRNHFIIRQHPLLLCAARNLVAGDQVEQFSKRHAVKLPPRHAEDTAVIIKPREAYAPRVASAFFASGATSTVALAPTPIASNSVF